ncbi:MAG: hypothetical protein JSW58_11125 [Candidatus Latescibacterota bacterium]|nr:MAG: hypothetical protein JSW58_11125 [Candidatus Latescibacterota bacterium]
MSTSRKTFVSTALIVALGLTALTITNCGDDGKSRPPDDIIGPQTDTIPPADVTDLRLRSPTHQTLALAWTAPGDDGDEGRAARYEICLSKSPITNENWEDATPLDPDIVPVPKPGGHVETIVVQDLDSSTRYYFALKTIDDADNESGLSNCVSEMTLAEAYPPADVADLAAVATDPTSFELTWTAPGDDWMSGTASHYDIRYASWPILSESGWDSATPLSDLPPPKPAGETESFTVTGIDMANYFFALKTADELYNWSGISNPAPALEFGEVLWAFPSYVVLGGETYVTFVAPTYNVPTRVSVHDLSYGSLYCGDGVIVDLVWETLPPGIYTVTFDFFNEETNRYFDFGIYRLSLCYGPSMQKRQWISFWEEPPASHVSPPLNPNSSIQE